MKHLALSLSILSFSSLSFAGNPAAKAHNKNTQDVVQKVEAHKAEATRKMNRAESGSKSALIKAERDSNLVTPDQVQQQKVSVQDMKQRRTDKVKNIKRAADSRTKKAAESL